MPRRRSGSSGGSDTSQLLIDWQSSTKAQPPVHHARPQNVPTVPPLVQMLPWDFKNSFPQPLSEAIDAGVIDESDTTPEGIRSMHQEYARVALATLAERDRLIAARRGGVDPATGRMPSTAAGRERLTKYLADEPGRQEHAFDVLMLTYGDAFGMDAQDAFTKALHARHAGIEVAATTSVPVPETEPPSHQSKVQSRRRVTTALPVPKPLASAVKSGQFGQDVNGPVRPGPAEVRSITEQHANKLIDMLHEIQSGGPDREWLQNEYHAGIAQYAEDFGNEAAARLDAHARHEARKAGHSRDR